MALINLTELRSGLARNQRILGIDLGRKRIGLAVSDVRLMLASPFGTLARRKLALVSAEIGAIARAEDVGGLLIGLPLSMDGSFGPSAQAARDWGRDLSDAVGLAAAMWDERLSSSAVNRFLIDEVDLSRGKRAESVDRSSAAWFLQSALDWLALGVRAEAEE